MRSINVILEIDKILSLVSSFAYLEPSKRNIEKGLIYSEKELPSELSFEASFILLSASLGHLHFGDGKDITYGLSLAHKGGKMEELDLLSLSHLIEDLEHAKTKAAELDEDNEAKDFILSLPCLEEVASSISKIIDPEGRVYDNASPKLKSLRREIARKKQETSSILPLLVKRYASYLSSGGVAYRDGHYVLPVAISYKNKVKGILIDLSSSENTAFIEPEELLLLQNEIAELEVKEKEEIAALLFMLSGKVDSRYEDCLALLEGAIKLDIAQAKAEFGFAYKGHLASLSEDGSLFLPGARHPLLDQDKAVPNDFILRKGAKVVVLSGPNAGGKTVALKTLAVNILLFEMAIPCLALEGGMIPYFKHVYADIGDNQSLEDNLSTFSGHIASISEICAKAGGKDIVFLDEIGTGTSPKEGEALAIATLHYLQNKHAYVLVSSHFEGLKALALENPSFDNASLIYDEEKLLPTYKLRFGSPGESYGLMAASRFGLQKEILIEANAKIRKGGQGAVSEAIKKLTRLQKENEALQEELKQKEEELKQASRRLKIDKDNFARVKDKFNASLEEEKEAYLASVKEEVNALIKELSNPDIKLHEAMKVRSKLSRLGQIEEENTDDSHFEIGDEVEYVAYGLEGKIVSIASSRAKISPIDGSLDFECDISGLRHKKLLAPIKMEKKEVGAFLDTLGSQKGIGLECNLIGMRVEEALIELDHYIDGCILSGFKRVRIIHGFGSGALRKATHDYLKAHKKIVESFELAGPQEGGSGATVVHLK